MTSVVTVITILFQQAAGTWGCVSGPGQCGWELHGRRGCRCQLRELRYMTSCPFWTASDRWHLQSQRQLEAHASRSCRGALHSHICCKSQTGCMVPFCWTQVCYIGGQGFCPIAAYVYAWTCNGHQARPTICFASITDATSRCCDLKNCHSSSCIL